MSAGRTAILNADAVEAEVTAAEDAADDASLMRAYATGDVSAFDRLYRRHKNALYRYLRHHADSADAAGDLFQDVWNSVIQARARYRPEAPFTAWLFRVAHNRLVDHWRSQRPAVPVPDDLPAPGQDQPEAVVERQHSAERLMRALLTLPVEQREIIVLREEQDLSLEEIAHIQGVGRETVKSRLRYALAKLREVVGHD